MVPFVLFASAFAHDPEPTPVPPPPPRPTEDQLHDELRALRSTMITALESRDLDGLGATLDDNVVFTATSGDVARGRDGVRKYAEKMLSGEVVRVKKFTFDASSDELSIFYNGGDTAIAWGPSRDWYQFGDGQEITMDTRWSATLVRDEGQWHIVSFHSSLPAFHNAVIDEVTGMFPWVGGGGLAVGVIVGGLLGFLVGRRRS